MIVEICSGRIRGQKSPHGGWRFLGIPFAAPPVGELRWRPPAPAPPWQGVREASAFPAAPIQTPPPRDHIMSQFSFAQPPESGISEDCLYLNVWAPDETATPDGAPLPVLFWIYGGGHRVGSASHPASWGEKLAARGCIVVAANYRVGALGYMAHPDLTAEAGASGNYASLDLLAALHWVQRNAAAFGGDPGRVTIIGQSAGAVHGNVLIASPLAKSLFHAAIAISGGRMAGGPMGRLRSLSDAEAEGRELMAGLGAADLDAMRSLPAHQLASLNGMWNLVEDGLVAPAQPQALFDAGQFNAVPVLAGYTSNEAAPYPSPQWATVAGMKAFAETFGPHATEFLELYGADTDSGALAQSYNLRRDIAFAYQPWRQARAMAASGAAKSWVFCLDQAPPLPDIHWHEPKPPQGYAAYHGADLWYAFGNFEACPWPWSDADRRVRDLLGTAIVNFASRHDPNGGSDLVWPELDDAGAAVILSGQSRPAPLPNIAGLRFFEKAFVPGCTPG